MRFRGLVIAVGFILMAMCAAAGQSSSEGIEGVITISPARPGPTRIDEAGSVPLADATFVVENNNTEVASFTTDEKGRFRLALPPGHYKASLKGRKTSIGRFGPFEFEVASGKMTSVQWECDSGIR